MPNCPNCGSDKFHYVLRSAGTTRSGSYYRTHRHRSHLFPAGTSTSHSTRKTVSIGFCPDCGYKDEPPPEKPPLTFADVVYRVIGAIVVFKILEGVVKSLLR